MESDHGSLPAAIHHFYFYPRSPYGERHGNTVGGFDGLPISTHALRMESDATKHATGTPKLLFLSTLSVWRATAVFSVTYLAIDISIHALRMESDRIFDGARGVQGISIHALRMESDGCPPWYAAP